MTDKIGRRVGVELDGRKFVARIDSKGKLTSPYLESLRNEGKLRVDKS